MMGFNGDEDVLETGFPSRKVAQEFHLLLHQAARVRR